MITERKEDKDSGIPLPTDRLLLIDLDKTLIDQDYLITDKNIFSEIQRVQNLGWQIGLSSDTPLEILKNWKREFGMNGPIIAERGALIELSNGTVLEPIRRSQKYFSKLKENLLNQLSRKNVPFYIGDAVSFLRNRTKLTGSADKKLVLVNAYRKCSLGFWGRKVNSLGETELDNILTEEFVKTLEPELLKPPFELELDFNKDYGLFIVSPKEATKRLGTLGLLKELHFSKMGMIGDSKTDIVGSDISFHYAVGNAKAELKEVADFVAASDYTSGVVRILSLIK